MVYLAKNESKDPISLQKIASETDIPEKYLEQILMLLRREGVIDALRGANGGYFLSKDPSEITMGSVISTLEGDKIADCIDGECENKLECKTHQVLLKLDEAINNSLEDITLSDLLE